MSDAILEPTDRVAHSRWLGTLGGSDLEEYVAGRLEGRRIHPVPHPQDEDLNDYLEECLQSGPDALRSRVANAIAKYFTEHLKGGATFNTAVLNGLERAAKIIQGCGVAGCDQPLQSFLFDRGGNLSLDARRLAAHSSAGVRTLRQLLRAAGSLQTADVTALDRWRGVLNFRSPVELGVEGFFGLTRALGSAPTDDASYGRLVEAVKARSGEVSLAALWSILVRGFSGNVTPERLVLALREISDVDWRTRALLAVVERIERDGAAVPAIGNGWKSFCDRAKSQNVPDPVRALAVGLRVQANRLLFSPSRHRGFGRPIEAQP